MHQPRKWWIGLPILAILAYVAAQTLTPQIEADLQARVAARLADEAPNVAVSGRDVAVSGLAPAAKERALAALRAEPGVRKVIDESSPATAAPAPAGERAAPPSPASREPYVFSATVRETLIAIEGKLPSEEMRKTAVALATATHAGLAVSDSAQIDAAAPPGDYAAALATALDALGALSQGRASLSDGKLAIEGRGKANVRADRLAADIKTRLPQGFELAKIEVAAGPVSPYVFEATREKGKAALSGFAPDEAAHKRIVEAARRRFFDATVDDRLAVAQGAPQNFVEAVEAALGALARLDEGKLSMIDATLSLSGAARYDSARAAIESALAERLPKSFKGETRLTAHTVGSSLDAPACRAALAELSKSPILFEADDVTIADDSEPLLDALTVTALRCQGASIEVAGHTDDRGIEELNRDRSKRRAQAVADRFVKAGADPSRVSAAGYGGARPVAPNDNDENRARNRRIEFIVK